MDVLVQIHRKIPPGESFFTKAGVKMGGSQIPGGSDQ